ncbi:hypothetical protein KC355_g8853 [Hortaea werneckii]|nr:hypothetical protein KC355_g8853 [Hortaea werneckii]
MITSGFTNAPVTKLLVFGIILTSFLATLTDTKYFFWIEVWPHLLDYAQFWRLLTWQVCYTNSTEVLFAAMSLYQLRIIERLWGTRKFASFLIATLPYTTLLPPILLATIIRPISGAYINYLPAGPTPILFALLAQYHAAIPYIYKYRLSSPVPATGSSEREYGLELTSKATSYLLPLQLAFSQLPGSAIAAGIGWIVGFAYRREVLPGAARWRVPSWAIGDSGQKERYASLRRRMEGEAGRATGIETQRQGEGARRRGMVGGLIDQFRGAALCGPTIAIEVGEGDSKANFQVFEGILCQFEWFARALKKDRFKGKERKITLPETSEKVFKYFQYFAFFGKVDFHDQVRDFDEGSVQHSIQEMVDLWVFCDTYDIAELQIYAIVQLRRLLQWSCEWHYRINDDTLALAHASTNEDSHLRIIFAEFIVQRIQEFGDPESKYEFLGEYTGFISELYRAKGRYDQTQLGSGPVTFPMSFSDLTSYNVLQISESWQAV